MSWSWRVGRIAGIPIYIHWTFLILIAWLVIAPLSAGQPAGEVVEQLVFVLALFGCVVLHELGHAMAARRYGVPTADITLLPIGGVARLQRIPEKPAEELVVAIAGPLVNVAIAGVLFLLGARWNVVPTNRGVAISERLIDQLLVVNVMLVLFNLLPAFPMDGGRILRALLALVFDYGRATRIAAGVGQLMAILFAFAGLGLFPGFGNPFLLFIALFVWIGAQSEAVQVMERLELKDVPVRDAMLTEFSVLAPTDTLGHAADLLLAGSQQDFPVLDGDHFVGILTRQALLQGLSQAGRDAPLAEVVSTEVETVEAGAMLVPAMAVLRERNVPCLPVVEDGRPVGLLTLENIAEYLMVKTALARETDGRARGPSRPPAGQRAPSGY
jgi:Zn-dependent protease/predicted transcriptional regulator